MNKSNLAFWTLTSLIFAAVFLPELLTHGMFFDGITYSSIARNMSEGLGSFWQPHYTSELYPVFYEHPPLAMGLQSLMFAIFGDQFFIEKIYSLLCLIATSISLAFLWSQFKGYKLAWIPLLIMMTIPITLWAFRNNILENTLIIFTTFSAVFFIRAEKGSSVFMYLMGCIFAFLAFLCKGPVGLFPLAIPLLFRLIFNIKNRYSLIQVSAMALFMLSGCFLLLFILQADAFENISSYMNKQLLPALQNEREITTTSRFTIILILFKYLAIPLILCLLVLALAKPINISVNRKQVLFFIAIGLSASVPLMLTLKQRDFYLLPSIPFYSIAFAITVEPYISNAIDKIDIIFSRALTGLSMLGIVVILWVMIFNFASFSRDAKLIQDVQATVDYVQVGSTIGSNIESCSNWSLVAYFMRYGKISISCAADQNYFLERKSSSVINHRSEIDLNLFILSSKSIEK